MCGGGEGGIGGGGGISHFQNGCGSGGLASAAPSSAPMHMTQYIP